MIYLDNAATSLPKPETVSYAVLRAMESMASPGRGAYAPAMAAADTVFRCREAAAELFHMAEPENVVFTMNATHGLNIAIRSLLQPGETVVISGFEHNAVTRPLHALHADIRVAGTKLFDPEDTIRSFRARLPGAKLAVCTYVSNVFGYILPIFDIAELCKRAGVPLIIDASQAAGTLDLPMDRLGAAFAAMPGHKGLFGPQGTGILLCRAAGRPLLYGGSGSDSLEQEMPAYLPDRLEAGTQNVCGIAGLLAGIEYVREKGSSALLRHERELLGVFLASLQAASCELFAAEDCQAGVLSIRSRDMDCEEIASRLSERGICVRAGLHCAPLAHRSGGTIPNGTVRFSFSPFLTAAQAEKAGDALREILS